MKVMCPRSQRYYLVTELRLEPNLALQSKLPLNFLCFPALSLSLVPNYFRIPANGESCRWQLYGNGQDRPLSHPDFPKF